MSKAYSLKELQPTKERQCRLNGEGKKREGKGKESFTEQW